MEYNLEDIAIVIPAYEPNETLIDYVKELTKECFNKVIIVDDGSHFDNQVIFEVLKKMNCVTVLKHDVNKGKGRALKTAYEYIKKYLHNINGVITADSDGQHLVKDLQKLAIKMKEGNRGLYLGTRDFSKDNVPFKSRNGNRITSNVFKLLYGKWLNDTQTGLRGFLIDDLDFMISIAGERYEYEMQVLIDCVRNKLPFYEVPIDTVYIDNNSGSHFNPFKDSFKIYKVIFKNFFKFMASSLICTGIDLLLFYIFSYLLFPKFGIVNVVTNDWLSGFVARLISSSLNFVINKNLVFKFKGNNKCITKYALLCVLIICASNLLVSSLELAGGARWLIKPLVDFVLYFVSYRVQKDWVFKR